MAEQEPGHTLEATALVHAAFLKLTGRGAELEYSDRRQFHRAAGEAM